MNRGQPGSEHFALEEGKTCSCDCDCSYDKYHEECHCEDADCKCDPSDHICFCGFDDCPCTHAVRDEAPAPRYQVSSVRLPLSKK